MASGTPIWLHICDVYGSCLRVRTPFPLTIQGSVVEMPLESMDDFVESIWEATDKLERDSYFLPNRNPGAFSETGS